MFESQRFARRIIISRNSIPFRASFSCGRREARSHGRDSPASRPCCEGRRFPFRRTPDRVLPGIPGERTTAVPARFRCRVIRSHRPSTGLPNPNNSVVATADNADSSLRSGRLTSAVPHFERSGSSCLRVSGLRGESSSPAIRFRFARRSPVAAGKPVRTAAIHPLRGHVVRGGVFHSAGPRIASCRASRGSGPRRCPPVSAVASSVPTGPLPDSRTRTIQWWQRRTTPIVRFALDA